MVKKILMICLGNICRSPIAEGVMIETIENAGVSADWKVDSAAIGGWHVGNSPDHRALKIMQNHNINYKNKARQIKKDDFLQFDYIFGMDEENMCDLRRLAPTNAKAKLLLLGDFGLQKSDRIIEDPYYQRGDAGFEKAYQQCVVACAAFLKEATAGKV
ncbi:low molecular weight phosphotyrosine protein phosphatase 1-like [Bactrocera neohumeralis]|uniref:low molecular weight phosphotyrosine protein phosphatase 1-like n=1 Tax=Bactrocera tryoni TaxID=59916 RepID=UPI001A976B32|nr:low molecular weight phosphotyrosine protein phosphatase 1-like [Bactrocera tryoni]XP_050341060.1 low molecular weight phosphotyrosine protein phosphatase 1-like [Bactrocera neohumeralis]